MYIVQFNSHEEQPFIEHQILLYAKQIDKHPLFRSSHIVFVCTQLIHLTTISPALLTSLMIYL